MQNSIAGVEVTMSRLDRGPDAVRAALRLLSEDERRRAERFAFDAARRAFVLARARLRELLAARLGVRPQAVRLASGPRGKPALASHNISDLRFNLSHSGAVAVYVLAPGREVGVDVEAVRAVPRADAMAARFFCDPEKRAYRSLSEQDRALGFLRCWTRKEALIKATGDGLWRPLGSFDVSSACAEAAMIVRLADASGPGRCWRLASFCPAPGFVAAVAAEEVDACAVR